MEDYQDGKSGQKVKHRIVDIVASVVVTVVTVVVVDAVVVIVADAVVVIVADTPAATVVDSVDDMYHFHRHCDLLPMRRLMKLLWYLQLHRLSY